MNNYKETEIICYYEDIPYKRGELLCKPIHLSRTLTDNRTKMAGAYISTCDKTGKVKAKGFIYNNPQYEQYKAQMEIELNAQGFYRKAKHELTDEPLIVDITFIPSQTKKGLPSKKNHDRANINKAIYDLFQHQLKKKKTKKNGVVVKETIVRDWGYFFQDDKMIMRPCVTNWKSTPQGGIIVRIYKLEKINEDHK